jgi:16S rRNA (uracil1498-N3)-methyltransferase
LTSNQFFVESIDPQKTTVLVEGDEHHHLARVSRIRKGEEIWLFDDDGRRCRGRVTALGKEKTEVLILERMDPPAPKVRLTLGQSVVNSKKMDFIIRKSTELGLAALIPLLAARSVQKDAAGTEKKRGRWAAVAREAAKQSKNPCVPAIGEPQKVADFAAGRSDDFKVFLSEHGGILFKEVLAGQGKSGSFSTAALCVGPEGGWTADEESLFRACGFKALSLGRSVLRTETAAILAVGFLSHFWNG